MSFPRPKFGLRTLFIAITAICALLYWVETQKRFVHDREVFKSTVLRASICLDRDWAVKKHRDDIPSLSYVRTLFDDQAYYLIYLPPCSREIVERATELFPEARIFAGGKVIMPQSQFGSRYLFLAVPLGRMLLFRVQLQRNFIKARARFVELKLKNGIAFDRKWAVDRGRNEAANISVVRRLLGDRAYYLILLPEKGNRELEELAKRLIAEAQIFAE